LGVIFGHFWAKKWIFYEIWPFFVGLISLYMVFWEKFGHFGAKLDFWEISCFAMLLAHSCTNVNFCHFWAFLAIFLEKSKNVNICQQGI
jgi:hypothetical protein